MKNIIKENIRTDTESCLLRKKERKKELKSADNKEM